MRPTQQRDPDEPKKWGASWIMTHTDGKDGEYRFYIGAICVAKIRFNKRATKWKCLLDVPGHPAIINVTEHESMSDAMKEMHRLLKSPPAEATTTR